MKKLLLLFLLVSCNSMQTTDENQHYKAICVDRIVVIYKGEVTNVNNYPGGATCMKRVEDNKSFCISGGGYICTLERIYK